MTKRNPKQVGSNLYSCRPQTGSCPIGCNQCFYNRPDAYYNDIHEPNVPDVDEVGSGIVRVNTGHDSNLDKDYVIECASQYKNYFFNTSISNFDFPGPVVFTANKCEEERQRSSRPPTIIPPNLMFVRLRASASNLGSLHDLVMEWTLADVPVVITFMAYYEKPALNYVLKHSHAFYAGINKLYEYKTRHINSYYCPTREMMIRTMKSLGVERNRLLTMCGTFDSNYCKDCRNCETYYWITKKRLNAVADINAANKGN